MIKFFRQHPIELSIVGLVALLSSILIHVSYLREDKVGVLFLSKAIMVGAMFLPLSTIISLSSNYVKATRLYKMGTYILGFVLSVLFVLSLGYDSALSITSVEVTKYIFILLVLFLWVFTFPSLFIMDKVTAWRRIQHSVSAFTIAFTSSLVVQIGITLAFAAISVLFRQTVDFRLIATISVWVMFALTAVIFLFRLNIEMKEKPAMVLHKVTEGFAKYILVPLQVLYTGILYFYFLTLLVNAELPSNQLIYLLLIFILPGFLSVLILYPLRLSNNRFSKIYYLFYAANLIPMMIVYFYSIGLRISEHGLTSDRAIVLIIGVLISVGIFYIPFTRLFRIDIYALVFGLMIIVAFCFPYFNINNVSRLDQEARFVTQLQKRGLISSGKVVARELDYMQQGSLRTNFRYLDSNYSSEFLKPYLQEGQYTNMMSKTTVEERLALFNTYIGADKYSPYEQSNISYVNLRFSDLTKEPLNIEGYSRAMNVRSNLNINVSTDKDKNTITVKYNGQDISIDLTQYVKGLHEKYNLTNLASADVTDANDRRLDLPANGVVPAITFVPNSISGYYDRSSEQISLYYVEGVLLFKK